MLRVLMILVPIALTIWALVDCISSKGEDIKHLSKPVWLLVIGLAWIIGPLAWLFLGRERKLPGRSLAGPRGGTASGRGGARGGWVAPDDNPEFLRSINEKQQREENDRDKELLESWEEDLRRREEELRDNGDEGGSQDGPSKS